MSGGVSVIQMADDDDERAFRDKTPAIYVDEEEEEEAMLMV